MSASWFPALLLGCLWLILCLHHTNIGATLTTQRSEVWNNTNVTGSVLLTLEMDGLIRCGSLCLSKDCWVYSYINLTKKCTLYINITKIRSRVGTAVYFTDSAMGKILEYNNYILYQKGTGNRYVKTSSSSNSLRLNEAFGHCQKPLITGKLFSPRSADELLFMHNTFTAMKDQNSIWFGLNDSQVEGTFQWNNGDVAIVVPTRSSTYPKIYPYLNWNNGNGGNDDNDDYACAELDTSVSADYLKIRLHESSDDCDTYICEVTYP